MITYQEEQWPDFVEDAKPIFPIHWEEMALNKDEIKLCLDFTRYEEAYAKQQIHVVTMRSDGKLVGYHVSFLLRHLHYADAGVMAYTDIYFILPEYRVGGAGAKLFMTMERTLRYRGIVKIYMSTKVHQDHSDLILALGYKMTDKVFTKLI